MEKGITKYRIFEGNLEGLHKIKEWEVCSCPFNNERACNYLCPHFNYQPEYLFKSNILPKYNMSHPSRIILTCGGIKRIINIKKGEK